MRLFCGRPVVLIAVLLAAASVSASAACLTIEEAQNNVGRTTCVTGKVLKVAKSQGGTHFLDFCTNYRQCPFTVVVFPKDLRDVGDVTKLEGETIDIHGKIQSHNGRAQIILKDERQLKGQFAKLPPPPKNYDADRKGRFSAGEFSTPKPSKKAK